MSETKWTQRNDPKDPGSCIITMRVPGRRPTLTLSGKAALDRVFEFCHAFLSGAGGSVDPHAMLEREERERLRDLREKAATMPYAVNVRGWSLAMATVQEGDSIVFTLSARLDPVRSTIPLDWAMVGQCAAIVGAPARPITPIEQTSNEAEPLIWRWTEGALQN